MISGHGDEYVGELDANFSSNVWYDADNTALYEYLYSQMQKTARYPETNAASLQQLIAQKNEINSNQLIVTNGSTEAFYLIAQSFANSVSMIVTPTFSEYADASKMHGHNILFTNRSNLSMDLEAQNPRLVWICNPNNPDGQCFSKSELIERIMKFQRTVFVIDQAYIDFSLTEGFSLSDVDKYPNLIIVQSLTKRYAIPGLRLGYLVANKSLVNEIRNNCIPWSVNTLAIAAGKYVLENDTITFPIEEWLRSSILLQNEIGNLENFEVITSHTPYFLVKLKNGKASALKEFLLEHKILIRQATNFEGLEGEYIRICALDNAKNELLISKLNQWNHFILQ